MRRTKVWRYHCDYCGKGGCSGGHIRRHEAACCRNPNRVCGMCALSGVGGATVPALLAAFGPTGDLKALRDAAEGCPACMLAAIIQSGIQLTEGRVEFDFAKERDAFWAEVNAERAEWRGASL